LMPIRVSKSSSGIWVKGSLLPLAHQPRAARQRRGKSFRDTFCEHFYVTTSGFFSDPALLCCVMEIGIDRIRFSVGYPFVDNPPVTKWTETLPLCAEDKEKLLSGNAKRLLKL